LKRHETLLHLSCRILLYRMARMGMWLTAGRILFALVSSIIIVMAGGGPTFISRPVGSAYLVLWISYWVVQASRQRGQPSEYDRRQRSVYLAGIVYLPILIIIPPWEYVTFSEPIPRDGPLAWFGLALFALGIILLASAMKTLGGLYTSYLGIQPLHHLVMNGPYKFIRHPGYLGEIMSMFGVGVSLSSVVGVGLAIASVLLVSIRLRHEEEMLMAEFGDEYKNYAKRTKRLIPFIY